METDNSNALEPLHEAICELAIKKTLTKSIIQKKLKESGIHLTVDDYMLAMLPFLALAEQRKRQAIRDFIVSDLPEWFTKKITDTLPAWPGLSLKTLNDTVVFVLEGATDIALLDVVDESWIRHFHVTAQTDDAVLIVGETGTSKQAMAQSIHTLSNRRQKQFVSINCAAIPEKLLEAELFGYEKGAFTDATAKKEGRLTMAKGGTVFLDEIGKMPVHLQGKILTALEDQQVFPLGAKKLEQIDCRFIAAVQPGDVKADAGKLLPDLLYRFGYPDVVRMPTLRERLDKNLVLVASTSFVLAKTRMNIGKQKNIPIHDDVYKLFRNRDFTGNYRELENILCYGIKMMQIAGREKLLPEDIMPILRHEPKASGDTAKTDAFDNVDDVPLKDIVGHAEAAARKLKESIVRRKVEQVTASGQTVFGLLAKEGIEEKARRNIYRKIKDVAGNLRDIR